MKYLSTIAGLGALVHVGANVAYPAAWTAHQPDGYSLGVEQVLLGTPSHHFAVAESLNGFYTTIKDSNDGFIKYAQIDTSTGELVPSDYIVGRDDPLVHDLPLGVTEAPNVVEAKCESNDYCRWHKYNNGIGSSVSGVFKNLVIPFKFADHSDRDIQRRSS